MAGLNDRNLQQLCTTQTLLNNAKNINHLVEFCNAYENVQLGQPTIVGAIKFTHQKDKRNFGPSHTTRGYCAGLAHEGINHEAGAADCPAYEATCVKCGRQDHTAKACKSEKPETNQVSTIRYDETEVTIKEQASRTKTPIPGQETPSSTTA